MASNTYSDLVDACRARREGEASRGAQRAELIRQIAERCHELMRQVTDEVAAELACRGLVAC